MSNNILDAVVRPAFLAIVGAEPHRAATSPSDAPAWSALYRQPKQKRDPLVVTVDLDRTGGAVVVHRAYAEEHMVPAVVLLRPGVTAQELCNAMNEAIVSWITEPNDGPRTA